MAPGSSHGIADIERMRMRDAALLARYRAGDKTVVNDLYREHGAMWTRVARRLTRNAADAEDLVAEALTRTIEAMEAGGGPQGNFSAYVVRAMRNMHFNARRDDSRHSEEGVEDLIEVADAQAVVTGEDSPIDRLPEVHALRSAFRDLPEHWRQILWLTEIEGKTPAELSDSLGQSPNAIAAMSRRAREGLREAYVARELPPTRGKDCDQFTAAMVAYAARGRAIEADSLLLDHASRCPDCAARLKEADRLAHAMRSLVVPALLGVGERGARPALSIPALVAGAVATCAVIVAALVIALAPGASAEPAAPRAGSVAAPAEVVPGQTPELASPPAPEDSASVEAPAPAPIAADTDPTPSAQAPVPTPSSGPQTTSLAVGLLAEPTDDGARVEVDFGALAAGETATAEFELPNGATLGAGSGWQCAMTRCVVAGPSVGPYSVDLVSRSGSAGRLTATVTIERVDAGPLEGWISGPIDVNASQ